MVGTGGAVLVSSGFSEDGSSGRTSIESSPSGPNGVSGDVFISSGASHAMDSGTLVLQTGSSKNGAGGAISVTIGDGGGMSDGGDISLTAGQTSAQGHKGGPKTADCSIKAAKVALRPSRPWASKQSANVAT